MRVSESSVCPYGKLEIMEARVLVSQLLRGSEHLRRHESQEAAFLCYTDMMAGAPLFFPEKDSSISQQPMSTGANHRT